MKDLHRSLWPLAAGALALALVVPLAAGARPPGGPERGLESRIEQLELDAETQASVDAILDGTRGERREVQRQLRAAHEGMRELFQAENADEAGLIAQAELISALQLELHKQRIASHLQLREVLSAAQMESLASKAGERSHGSRPRYQR
jgi:Spy/CpxP family protein refolding chaperone